MVMMIVQTHPCHGIEHSFGVSGPILCFCAPLLPSAEQTFPVPKSVGEHISNIRCVFISAGILTVARQIMKAALVEHFSTSLS